MELQKLFEELPRAHEKSMKQIAHRKEKAIQTQWAESLNSGAVAELQVENEAIIRGFSDIYFEVRNRRITVGETMLDGVECSVYAQVTPIVDIGHHRPNYVTGWPDSRPIAEEFTRDKEGMTDTGTFTFIFPVGFKTRYYSSFDDSSLSIEFATAAETTLQPRFDLQGSDEILHKPVSLSSFAQDDTYSTFEAEYLPAVREKNRQNQQTLDLITAALNNPKLNPWRQELNDQRVEEALKMAREEQAIRGKIFKHFIGTTLSKIVTIDNPPKPKFKIITEDTQV